MIAQLEARPSLAQLASVQRQLRQLDPEASVAVDYGSHELLIRAKLRRPEVEGAFAALGIVPVLIKSSEGGCCGGCGCA